MMSEAETLNTIDRDQGNFSYKEDYAYDAGVGLTEETVEYISKVKKYFLKFGNF